MFIGLYKPHLPIIFISSIGKKCNGLFLLVLFLFFNNGMVSAYFLIKTVLILLQTEDIKQSVVETMKVSTENGSTNVKVINQFDTLCLDFNGSSFYGLEYVLEDFFQNITTKKPVSADPAFDWFGLYD